MKWIVALLLPCVVAGGVVAGGVDSAGAVSAAKNEMVKTDRFTGVIFAPESGAYVPYEGTPERWLPRREQVLQAETCVAPVLKKREKELRSGGGDNTYNIYRADQVAAILRELTEYERQYFGIVRDGMKMIYMNFLHDVSLYKIDWRTRGVMVLDGGRYFFQMLFDVKSGVCSHLTINGEA